MLWLIIVKNTVCQFVMCVSGLYCSFVRACKWIDTCSLSTCRESQPWTELVIVLFKQFRTNRHWLPTHPLWRISLSELKSDITPTITGVGLACLIKYFVPFSFILKYLGLWCSKWIECLVSELLSILFSLQWKFKP